VKNIEEMDLYEVMNVSQSASQQDIEKAFEIAQISYGEDSLAHYTLMDEEQRKKTLEAIEAAYKILSDPEKRKEYDRNQLKQKSEVYHNSYFRNSTEKLFIEDGDRGLVKVVRNIKKTIKRGPSKKK